LFSNNLAAVTPSSAVEEPCRKQDLEACKCVPADGLGTHLHTWVCKDIAAWHLCPWSCTRCQKVKFGYQYQDRWHLIWRMWYVSVLVISPILWQKPEIINLIQKKTYFDSST
jgi:hypothetical protein